MEFLAEIFELIVSNPVFRMTAIAAIPVVILPLLMRFAVSGIIIAFSRRRYLSALADSVKAGYSSDEDKQAVYEVIDFAKKKLGRFTAFRANFVEDGKLLLLRIKNAYEQKSDREKLTFPFSVTRLSECLMLAFSDLYTEYSGAPWFKAVRNTRLVWFVRFSRLKYFWDLAFRFRFIERLRSARVLGRIARVLLVPVIGVPFILWYVCQSVFTSVFLEGAFRFFYSVLIMKAGYYAIHVFGSRNPFIEKQIARIRGYRLESAYKAAERLLDPRTWETWSNRLPAAVDRYSEILALSGLAPDSTLATETESIIKKLGSIARRFAGSLKRAYARENPFKKDSNPLYAEIIELVTGLSSVYRPGVENPLLYLRIKEIIASAYIASLMIYYGIKKIPLLSRMLDKVTVELVMSVSGFIRKQAVRRASKGIKKTYKAYKLAAFGYKAYRLIRGFAGPVSLAISAASPIVMQQIQDKLKEYLFHRCGRLVILAWESDIAKRNLMSKDLMILEEK